MCAHQLFHGDLGGLAIEHETIKPHEISPLDPAIQSIVPRRARLAAAQQMDDGDDGVAHISPQPPVQPQQRRMVELILQQGIKGGVAQSSIQVEGEVVPQVASVGPPGQGDDVHLISLAAQMLD
jgi:hypothetical protein